MNASIHFKNVRLKRLSIFASLVFRGLRVRLRAIFRVPNQPPAFSPKFPLRRRGRPLRCMKKILPEGSSATPPPLHIYVREIHLSGSCVMTTVNERTPILRRSETDDAPPRTWTRRPLYGAVFCSLLAFGTNSLVLSNGGWCPVQRRRQRESVRTSSSTRADPILVLSSEPGRASLHTDPVFAIAH